MKQFLIFFLLFLNALQGLSQDLIIQRSNEIILYDDVTEAFVDLEPGDELYIPGGTYDVNLPCSILSNAYSLPDSIKIFGAGHYLEYSSTTGKTVLNGNLPGGCSSSQGGILQLGDDNIITGIEFNFMVILSDNNSVSYCKLIHVNGLFNNNHSVDFRSNIVESGWNSGYFGATTGFGLSGNVSNNIIEGLISTGDNGLIFDSNIFLDTTFYAGSLNLINGTNAVIQNNVFITEHTDFSSLNHHESLIYRNNIFVGIAPQGLPDGTWDYQVNTNNIFSPNSSTLFENYTYGAPFSYGFDFHLTEGHPGIGADTNGENIGIYKTDDPTENKIPFNPHFISKIISSQSDGNGMLNIQIEVEAREN